MHVFFRKISVQFCPFLNWVNLLKYNAKSMSNITFSIFEFFGGIFTNSVAILSDSIHDLGDALSIGISYFLEKKIRQLLLHSQVSLSLAHCIVFLS